LTREGRSAATAGRVYVTASGKIKEFGAWMLPRSGREIRYGKDRILDVAVVNNDIYNEVRSRRLSAVDDAQDGMFLATKVVKRIAPYLRNSSGGFSRGCRLDVPLQPHASSRLDRSRDHL